MTFRLGSREIAKVGIVGSGQIGPDIALHFARALAPHGTPVVVVDVSEQALQSGERKLTRKLDKLVSRGRLKPEKLQALLARLTFTTDYSALADAQLVVEAASEDLAIKQSIFDKLESLCSLDALLTSNSSHLEPEVIFEKLKQPERTAITHYFFPAERNPLVEVVSGERTSAETSDFLMQFYEVLGKFPVRVRSRYGYAIDPIFEGLFLAGCLAVERDMGTLQQVDYVCQKALGQGVGPFTAMNLTGGNPLTRIGLSNYRTKIMDWYHCPDLLETQLEKGMPWETAGRDDVVEIDPRTESVLTDWMLGAYFGLTCEVLDADLIDMSDYDEALGIGLSMTPAFSLMNKKGIPQAFELVSKFAKQNSGFRISARLRSQADANKPWPLKSVVRTDVDDVAVLTIRRFKVLNALNEAVLAQLEEKIEAIGRDATIRSVVIRGFGTRAFVSGADINELAALKTRDEAVAKARRGQQVLSLIENLDKPVVAAMNGLAFGGGSELAMACHARVAAAGQRVFMGQPEPKLGVIPGYGGTQRLPRWIGLANAWPILRNGDPISSAQALELGLIQAEVPATELLDYAIKLSRDAASGSTTFARIKQGPLDESTDQLPEVELGHLSTAVDRLVQDAVLKGASASLDEGLKIEAETFGQCLATEDCRIGMENFVKNGPKKPAAFVNR